MMDNCFLVKYKTERTIYPHAVTDPVSGSFFIRRIQDPHQNEIDAKNSFKA